MTTKLFEAAARWEWEGSTERYVTGEVNRVLGQLLLVPVSVGFTAFSSLMIVVALVSCVRACSSLAKRGCLHTYFCWLVNTSNNGLTREM